MFSHKFLNGVHLDIDITGLSPEVMSPSYKHAFEGKTVCVITLEFDIDPLFCILCSDTDIVSSVAAFRIAWRAFKVANRVLE